MIRYLLFHISSASGDHVDIRENKGSVSLSSLGPCCIRKISRPYIIANYKNPRLVTYYYGLSSRWIMFFRLSQTKGVKSLIGVWVTSIEDIVWHQDITRV